LKKASIPGVKEEERKYQEMGWLGEAAAKTS